MGIRRTEPFRSRRSGYEIPTGRGSVAATVSPDESKSSAVAVITPRLWNTSVSPL